MNILHQTLCPTLIFIIYLYNVPVLCLEYTHPSEKSNNHEATANTTTISELAGIEFSYELYRTWGHGIEVASPLLVVHPKNPDEILAVVNWAHKNGRKVRPRGYKHSFPPLTVTSTTDSSKVLLVDMMKHLTKLQFTGISADQTVNNKALNAVTAETGATWEDFMIFCESNNVSIVHSIIIGDATVGGVMAIGAHGAAVPTLDDSQRPGYSFGSLSNLIAAFKAVVWDADQNAYVIKSFSRSDPDASAFLVHVGRAFLTEVTLIVGENYNLRCKSITYIPAEELFANPKTSPNATRTLASFLDQTGRADVQWYQFTKNPWLKLWSIEKEKPSACFEVTGPYNYQFPVNVKVPSKTIPELGEIAYNNVIGGLDSTNSSDIWGRSKNILLYSNGSSQSIVYGGFVVLIPRDQVQETLSVVVGFYKNLTNEYAMTSDYPIEYYIKFRVTGIDFANETFIKNAVDPLLSPLTPPPEYPNFNTALWMNTFTSRENKLGNTFMRRFEAFYFETFNGSNGLARPEWSKSWAYADEGEFLNTNMLNDIIPSRFGSGWANAKSIFNKYDPDHIFSNTFLDSLFK